MYTSGETLNKVENGIHYKDQKRKGSIISQTRSREIPGRVGGFSF